MKFGQEEDQGRLRFVAHFTFGVVIVEVPNIFPG
jgi:hypothetical protein